MLDVLKGKLIMISLGSVVVMRFCLGGVGYRIDIANVSHLDDICNPSRCNHLGVPVECSSCTYLGLLICPSWLRV